MPETKSSKVAAASQPGSGLRNLCRSLRIVFSRARSRPSLVPIHPPTGLVYGQT
ncbi:hypothetical protein BT93_L3492 [Corymbia citriodora subsp. variegata]|uniref:Uncharacterized protein n=1 Tax=Corymbia citriodora subsp. variegata TaxID=360336 RepID=A0A8T0CZE1_CORYI|nr:hypothetical protein BT93_L3492 [Corymbia citriodora subsp. variegata]